MKNLNESEIMEVSGGLIKGPSQCANAMMASGGFGAAFGGLIGGLVGSLIPGPGTAFGAVLGASLMGGGAGAAAAQSSACQEPAYGQCTAESGLQ